MSDKKITDLPLASTVNATDVSVLVSNGTDYQFAFSTLLQLIGANVTTGANISFGAALPQNTTGNNGDVFINTGSGSFAQKVAGIWTVVYTLPSTSGTTDGTVLYGLGIPGISIGNNNDTYIDTGTGIFYKKAAGQWAQIFSMQTGPAGAPGSAGTNGANGTNGFTILNGTTTPSNTHLGVDGDFYINTVTYTLFGPKTAGNWGAGFSLIGGIGPSGPAGVAGPTGPAGVAGAVGAIGPAGTTGATGAAGPGVATGGTVGQVLAKIDSTDYHTQWVTMEEGTGSPGGSNSQLQFNNGGIFGGSPFLSWDNVNGNLIIKAVSGSSYGKLIFSQSSTGTNAGVWNRGGGLVFDIVGDGSNNQYWNTDGSFQPSSISTGNITAGLIIANGLNVTGTIATGRINYDNATWYVGTGNVSGSAANDFIWQASANFMSLVNATGNLLIGTTIDIPCAILQLSSTTKGFLPPSMSTIQKNAISLPVSGLMVYDNTIGKLSVFNGSDWETIASS